jgi:hypothetical protein
MLFKIAQRIAPGLLTEHRVLLMRYAFWCWASDKTNQRFVNIVIHSQSLLVMSSAILDYVGQRERAIVNMLELQL